jgi:hypothetical protein
MTVCHRSYAQNRTNVPTPACDAVQTRLRRRARSPEHPRAPLWPQDDHE